jgi:hypothetical protein
MTAKKPGKGAAPAWSVVWTFGDKQYRKPLPEHEKELLRQWHRMADSDSPELREAGQRLLDEHAAKTAQATIDGLKKQALRPKQAAGGKASAAARATNWHTELETAARKLLVAGTEPHELASKLKAKPSFANRDIATIRRILKKTGVK